MSNQNQPIWGKDSLSRRFEETDYNARVAAANYPDVHALLCRAHGTFENVEGAVEHDSESIRLVPRFLLVRCHSAWLAAVRVGTGGQITEAFVLLRSAVECAWYALHMAKDTSEGDRVMTWLRRNKDARSAAQCKSEFTTHSVRTTHESHDLAGATELHRIYESLIDYGAHPNQMGVFTGLKQHESTDQTNYKVGILYPDELGLMVTLRFAIAVAIGSLNIFQLIYPERFELMRIDREIAVLKHGLSTGFKRFEKRPSA